jgi:hypothetical protein
MMNYYGKMVTVDFAIVDLFEALRKECGVKLTEGINEVARNFKISPSTVRDTLEKHSDVARNMMAIRKGMRILSPEEREEILTGFSREIETRLKWGNGTINEYCERRRVFYRVSIGTIRDVVKTHPGYRSYVRPTSKGCGKR